MALAVSLRQASGSRAQAQHDGRCAAGLQSTWGAHNPSSFHMTGTAPTPDLASEAKRSEPLAQLATSGDL